jgi:predicted transcriptional regulator
MRSGEGSDGEFAVDLRFFVVNNTITTVFGELPQMEAIAKQTAIEPINVADAILTCDDKSDEIELHRALDEAIVEVDAGRVIPHEQVMREMYEWIRK